jgi:glycosyltransferase involved in cell wall biosynthesis
MLPAPRHESESEPPVDGAVAPVVSVVMATYNRSNVIGYAIRSLRAQSFADWELIVVGDACTDDTGAVVAAFGDPRIRFHNRSENFGEQSGPNNDGVRMARGRYVAFLNHDDFWAPEHLGTALDTLQSSAADMVYSVGLAAYHDVLEPTLVGATTRRDRYHPTHVVPCSLWVFRRELAQRVGPWRPAIELRAAASNDWIYRAWRSGARIVPIPRPTVYLLTSPVYRDAYSGRGEDQHARVEALLSDPRFLLHTALRQGFLWQDRRSGSGLWWLLGEWIYALAVQALLLLRVFPPRPRFWLRNFRRGMMIQRLRRLRGLAPLPTRTNKTGT